MNARSFLVVLVPLIVHAGLSRHNEQGLSPTHSYKRTGSEGVISNLNGNLVVSSVPVSIAGAPLGVNLTRTWNSHWRDPLLAFQYDMDYNGINLSDPARRNPVYRDQEVSVDVLDIGGFATRRIHKVGNPAQVPQMWGFAQAISMSVVDAAAQKAIMKAVELQYQDWLMDYNLRQEVEGSNFVPTATDKDNINKLNASTSAALKGLQIALYAINGAGDDVRTLESCYSSAVGDRSSAKGDCGQAGFNVVANLGSQYVPFLSDINMGYKVATGKADGEDVAWYLGTQLGQIIAHDALVNIAGEAVAQGYVGGIVGVSVALTIQAARIYLQMEANWEKTFDIGYVSVNPWAMGVNGYVGMLGTNHDPDLQRAQGRFQYHWIAQAIRAHDTTADTVNLQLSYSRHPMPEMHLVGADGGATRFVLSDDSARTVNGRRWVAYEALSNAEQRRVYYCLPRGTADQVDLGLNPRDVDIEASMNQDTSGYYVVKEPDGTQVEFGVGPAKGIKEDHDFHAYWAVPTKVRTPTGDSLLISRDGGQQIASVRDAQTGRGAVVSGSTIISGVLAPDGQLVRGVDTVWSGGASHEFLAYQTGNRGDVHWSTNVLSWEAKRVNASQIDTVKYQYGNGNMVSILSPNGSMTRYDYDSTHFTLYDGFVHAAVDFPDRTDENYFLKRVYEYSGWNDTRPSSLKTSIQTILHQPDHVVNPGQIWREGNTVDWYYFAPMFESKNINRKMAGFVGRTTVQRLDGTLHDTDKVLDSLEYKTSRFHLIAEYHGAGSPGQKRTQYIYDGDRQIAEIQSHGMSQTFDPRITRWDYDQQGSMIRQTVCPKRLSDSLAAKLAKTQGLPPVLFNCPEVVTEYGVRHRNLGEFWNTKTDTLVIKDSLVGGTLRVATVTATPNPAFRVDSLYRLGLNTSQRTWRRGAVRDDGVFVPTDSALIADSTEWEDWRATPGSTPYVRPVRSRVWLDGRWQTAAETRYADNLSNFKRPALVSRTSRYLTADSVAVVETSYDSVFSMFPARTRQYVRPQVPGAVPAGPSLDTARFFDVDHGWVLALQDPAGHLTTTELDRTGRPLKVTRADGGISRFGYIDRLEPTSAWRYVPGYLSSYPAQRTVGVRETDPSGVTTEARFDGLGRMVALKRIARGAPLNTLDTSKQTTTLLSYNIFDKLQWKRDPDGREEWHDFDGIGREISGRIYQIPAYASNQSLSWESRYQWADSSRTLVERDPIGTRTTFHWDAFGRDTLIERDADTAAFRFRVGGEASAGASAPLATSTIQVHQLYDNLGNLLRLTDPKGLVEVRRYDQRNRLVRTVYPDDLRHMVGYDLASRGVVDSLQMISRVDSLTIRRNTYDALDRPLTESFGSQAVENIGYSWDMYGSTTDPGRLLAVTRGTGLVASYGYDALGRRTVRNLSSPNITTSQTWKYDSAGSPIRADLPGLAHLSTGYDQFHRLANVSLVHGSDSTAVLHDMRYRANDLLATYGLGPRLTAQNSFEPQRSVLTESLVRSNSGDTLYLQRMSWDGAGNVAGMRRNLGDSLGFDVDHQYQLREVHYPDGQALQLGYDLNGNRTRLSHPMGRGLTDTFAINGNRVAGGITARRGWTSYRHDSRGNLAVEASFAWVTDSSDLSKAWRLVERKWNRRNELDRVRIITRLDRTDTTWLRFDYGEDGNRILSFVAKGDTTTWSPVHKWVYDGSAIVADSGSDHSWTWHAYNGMNRVAEATDSSGRARVRYVLTDNQGTTQALLNDTGALLGRWIWDPWGNIEESWTQRSTDLLYQGKAYENALGEWYFNARWYSAERGMFTGRDAKEQFWTPYGFLGNAGMFGIDPDGQVDLGEDPTRPNIHVDYNKNASGDMKFEDFYVDKSVRQYVALQEGGSDPFGLYWNLHDIHWYERSADNGLPPQDEGALRGIQGWEQLPVDKSIYHMQAGAVGNRKWVNNTSGQEIVFTPSGNVVMDPRNAGTFNYGPPVGGRGLAAHLFLDMLPYWTWGNSMYDNTPFVNRFCGPMNGGRCWK